MNKQEYGYSENKARSENKKWLLQESVCLEDFKVDCIPFQSLEKKPKQKEQESVIKEYYKSR